MAAAALLTFLASRAVARTLSLARSHGGLGLGLAIVDFLVKAHGGWVGAASGPGPGTTFTVHLPEAF